MTKRILVVDDDPSICTFFRAVLELEGYEVITAENGKLAIRAYQEAEFDLVITDIVMPEKEGLETIRELRGIAGKDLPIIAVSGGGSVDPEHYLKYARMLGANNTLSKPISHDELINAVAELIGSAK